MHDEIDEIGLLLERMAVAQALLEFTSLLREYESLEQWADGVDDKRQRQREAAREQLRLRRAGDNNTWTQLLAEYDAGAVDGRWKSRNTAAEQLAGKYGFAATTIRKRLRARPLGANN